MSVKHPFTLKYRFLLLVLLLAGADMHLKAQQWNAYQFIGPNISISYDSNYFKVGNWYSNSPYNDAYDFTLKNDAVSKTWIYIEPRLNNGSYITEATLDSFMQAGMQEFKNKKSKDLLTFSYDTIPVKINGFTCIGIILCDKDKKHFIRTIICNHISQNDLTTVKFTSFGNTSLQNDYLVLTKFFSGFASYSPEQIAAHDASVRENFKVTVTQTKKPGIDTTVTVKNGVTNYYIKPHDYEGIVKISPLSSSPYIIKQVRIKLKASSFQIFEPLKNGDVIISCGAAKKGTSVTQYGEIIMGHLLDKDVSIPFTFSYINE